MTRPNDMQTPALSIGKTGSRVFALPADVQTRTVAVLGIRGSGKTNTAVVMAEELLALGRQIVIIDPTDVWWGLRSSADGKKPGQPIVVCGGAHGQVPLTATDGGVLADFAVSERASLILSLRHLRKGDQRQFVTDFAEQLYHRKGEAGNRTPLLVIIDECDAFVPQRVVGAEARMVGAIEDLVRRGRAAGLGVVLISQRAASVNKDVLTQLELLVAHRHTSPQDRKALDAWVEAHDTAGLRAEFHRELASLPVGTAWFWSPGWVNVFARVAVRARRTFDSSSTPTSAGAASTPSAVAEVDLEGLRQKLAATIEAAEANDPRKLKARIAELEAELDAAKAEHGGVPDGEVEQRVHAAVQASLAERDREWEQAVGDGVGVLTDAIQRTLADVCQAPPRPPGVGRVMKATVGTSAPAGSTPAGRMSRAPAPPQPPNPRLSSPGGGAAGNGDLTGYQRDLLAVLLERSPVPTPRGQLGGLAGRSIKSSAFEPNLRSLVERGLAERTDRGYVASRAALAACPDAQRPPRSGRAALEYWLNRLPAYESSLLRALAEAYPRVTDEAALAERAGRSVTSSAFRPALRNLVELGHVEDGGGRFKLFAHLAE